MRSDTSWRVWNERPKSNLSAPDMKLTYCSTSGRSRPNDSRMAATLAGVAYSPRMACAGSPGTRRTNRNTTVRIPTMVGIPDSRRLSTKASHMGGASARQRDREEPGVVLLAAVPAHHVVPVRVRVLGPVERQVGQVAHHLLLDLRVDR